MMKKVLMLGALLSVSMAGFAQKTNHTPVAVKGTSWAHMPAAKTSGAGDTLTLSNMAAASPFVLYKAGADSGYLTGTNVWGDKAFAELYTFNGHDSSMKVIGVFAQFGGSVSALSSKTVSLKIWSAGGPQMVTDDIFYNTLPGSVQDSLVVPAKQLGIGATVDTLKKFMFAASTAKQYGPFFAGYSINYNFATLGGDTIAIASTADGARITPAHVLTYTTNAIGDTTDIDTVIIVQNATQWSDGTWHDNYTDNDSLFNDLAIFPIVVIGNPSEVKSVTRKSLTFYGCYPNPAVNSTNVKISLAQRCDVTITVTDVSGRVISTSTHAQLAAGAQELPLNTTEMPAGAYYYIVRTSEGDGIAGVLEIVK